MRVLKFLAVLCIAALLTVSCSHKKADDDEKLPGADELYHTGFESLQKKKYKDAVEKFEDIERTYPYSEWATRAQILSAYASYLAQEYDKALSTLERFIKLHPGYKDVDYAYYLRGLCYYEQISDVGRDQSYSQQALQTLQEIVARFPDSKYARDAQIKLDLVRDHLAGKEVAIGRFYLKGGKPIAAINRFKVVVDKYPTTVHVEEALHRLVEVYMSLGVEDEARKYAAVLGHNYPSSKWYEYSYDLLEGKKAPHIKIDPSREPEPLPEVTADKKKDSWFKMPFKVKKGDGYEPPAMDRSVKEVPLPKE